MLKIALLATAAAGLFAAVGVPAVAQTATKTKPIVVVHGAWADGSGWWAGYNRLVRAGHNVFISQNALNGHAVNVANVRRAIARADGPVISVGDSYGGAVVTEAGNDPEVEALVYVAAFAPDRGESTDSLGQRPAPGATPPPLLVPKNGLLLLDPAKFAHVAAADVPNEPAEIYGDFAGGREPRIGPRAAQRSGVAAPAVAVHPDNARSHASTRNAALHVGSHEGERDGVRGQSRHFSS